MGQKEQSKSKSKGVENVFKEMVADTYQIKRKKSTVKCRRNVDLK